MQNRYAGDVGDFGKFGLLRKLETTGLKIGLNWYLVADEDHNQDGKHIGYQKNRNFQGCDDQLLQALNTMLEQNDRSVVAVENLSLLKDGVYYHAQLHPPTKANSDHRTKWLAASFDQLKGCDLVFLDPDNGMLPKSIGRHRQKSIKYVFPEEILAYYQAGHSVVFYSHRTREKQDVYRRRFDALFSDKALADATIKGISFKRGTLRDYCFILHENHAEKVEQCLAEMLKGNWVIHFDEIDLKQTKGEGSQDAIEKPTETTNAKKRKSTKSTEPGYVNKNNQRNNGRTDIPGTGHGQWFYDMECLHCGHRYYANGHDVWLRKCPKCQGGRA